MIDSTEKETIAEEGREETGEIAMEDMEEEMDTEIAMEDMEEEMEGTDYFLRASAIKL